jgi:hypothetical protein
LREIQNGAADTICSHPKCGAVVTVLCVLAAKNL